MVGLQHDQIEIAKTSDLAGVRTFYASVGYGGGVNADDRVLVASEARSIVAAARLCSEGGTLVLRGMYVAESLRGKGIGSRLLEIVSDAIESSECWCIPYTHLTGFYSQIGFRVYEREKIPSFLVDRWERYAAKGHKVAVMQRPAG